MKTAKGEGEYSPLCATRMTSTARYLMRNNLASFLLNYIWRWWETEGKVQLHLPGDTSCGPSHCHKCLDWVPRVGMGHLEWGCTAFLQDVHNDPWGQNRILEAQRILEEVQKEG
jgi:hypothetical protein